MAKERKEYVAFYLEKSVKKKIQAITENPNSTFDDVSSFIRYAVKRVLVEVEQQLLEDSNQINKK
jgi:hypothetical protein